LQRVIEGPHTPSIAKAIDEDIERLAANYLDNVKLNICSMVLLSDALAKLQAFYAVTVQQL
jgi:hexokinase